MKNIYILSIILFSMAFNNSTFGQDREAPQANCASLTVSLNSDCVYRLTAEELNDGSYDDVTNSSQLRYEVALISNKGFYVNRGSYLDLQCYHRSNCIALFVIDEAGNESVCRTDVNIRTLPECDQQDCSVNYDKDLKGDLVDIFSRPITNVAISFDDEVKGVFHGSFEYEIQGTYDPSHDHPRITYQKHDGLEDAWDLRDMAILRNWILDTVITVEERRNSFLGDINGDGSLSTLDLIMMRRYVLDEIEFPDISGPRWYFLNKDFDYPYFANFNRICHSNVPFWLDMEGEFEVLGFVPGDVDGSVNRLSGLESSRIRTNDRKFLENETVHVQFELEESSAGVQGMIEFDPEVLQFIGSSFESDEINAKEAESGRIRFLQLSSNGDDLRHFELEFLSLKEGQLSKVLSLDRYKSKALTASTSLNAMELKFYEAPISYLVTELELDHSSKSKQNGEMAYSENEMKNPFFPNPFVNQLNLKMYLERHENIVIRLRNTNGKVLYETQLVGTLGENEFLLAIPDLGNITGVLLAEIEKSEKNYHFKLVKI